jgi:hypothetical protein
MKLVIGNIADFKFNVRHFGRITLWSMNWREVPEKVVRFHLRPLYPCRQTGNGTNFLNWRA